MNIVGEKVFNKIQGEGTIISQTEKHLVVAFKTDEIKYQYPEAFEKFLVLRDAELQKAVVKEIEDKKQAIAELQKKEAEKIIEIPLQENKKKPSTKHSNIAFKCTFCDGGNSADSIGFKGICSDWVREYNIKKKMTWCNSEKAPCYNYHCGNITRDDLYFDYDGFVCYESRMLLDWKAMAGVVQNGTRKGEPLHIKQIQTGSLCVLTTREPYSKENERIIFAVFLIDDVYEGDDSEEGFVSTQSKYKLSLSRQEAEKMPFWHYHANDKNPEKEAWGTGLYRYLTDIQAVQILRDIAEIKKNTKDEKLAAEFLTNFCKTVCLDVDKVGEPSGALTKK